MLTALQTLVDNGLSDSALQAVLNDLLDNDSFDDDDDKRCCVALAWAKDQGENVDPDDVTHEHGQTVSIGRAEYIVCDDDEADEVCDACLESMLDDGGIVPGADSAYFDRERWKKDALIDGRGHHIASYDGEEQEFCVRREGEGACNDWYFLYRIG